MTSLGLWSKDSFFREIQTLGKIEDLLLKKTPGTDPSCGLSIIFCGFISHLIGRETEIFSSVHGFMGKTVKTVLVQIFLWGTPTKVRVTLTGWP